MQPALVIVESPAKAKTINKYLGKEYIVKSCVGHIRDLPVGSNKAEKAPLTPPKDVKTMTPEEKKAWQEEKQYHQLVSSMGIDPEHGWRAQYQILPGKEKVVKELKSIAKKSELIYLATDLDREGEAIAWHLKELLGGDDARYKRVVFNEITKTAINKAFEKPGHIDMEHVEAQQTRRFLDRVVGFMLSPLLWKKVARGLSAGRVQSVAVKLVVEREREVRAFIPEEYWEIHNDLQGTTNEPFNAQVTKHNNKAFRPNNEEDTQTAVDILSNAPHTISDIEQKASTSRPSPPFITSTLQQAASTRLGYGVKKTMMLAQRLYEAGYITYMRTDATALSQDSVKACRDYINKQFGENFLPESPNFYSSKAGAQEAHEAIRPTDLKRMAATVEGVDPDAKKLYQLIWNQFVACQMTPARFQNTVVTIKAEDYILKTKGRIIEFEGFMKVLPPGGKKAQDVILPVMKKGDTLSLMKVNPSQHFTKPPGRFSEASLVKELEKRGIGRPSTYASIISTIQDRGYVHIDSKRFYADKMGEIVADRLSNSFTDLMSYDFTAGMEEKLDKIAQGDLVWDNVLNEFYAGFKLKLEAAYDPESGMASARSVDTKVPCTKCGRPMAIRHGSTGSFLGCTAYGLKGDEQCKTTINLSPADAFFESEEEEIQALSNKKRCKICDDSMDAFLIDETKKLHVCGNSPTCPGHMLEEGQFELPESKIPTIECDKCSEPMEFKQGRFGPYYGCTSCKNTRKILASGQPAPPKMDPIPMPETKCIKVDDYYILRDGAAGLFMAASQFPKHRETRAPFISELISVKKQLEEKYQYLLSAPEHDQEGNPAQVRFSRKTKESYIMSEAENKPTKWRLFYQNGKWEQVEKKAKASKKTKK